jgi:hypothetical protein
VSPRVREDSVHPRLQSGASGRPLNFTVRGRAGLTRLSRIGATVVVVGLITSTAAFTLGVFHRTMVGALLLLFVGLPVCAIGEALGEIAFARRPRAWYIRAGAVIAVVSMLGILWWWWESHASFVHHNFLG